MENSSQFNVENFSQFNFDSNICKAITQCGYETPTPVQKKSIPEVLTGRDVVVSAQTGTGKTAAFVLPILHLLSLKEACKKTRVLILTPTRELAAQITKAAALYGKFMRFNIVSLVGGMSYHHQIKDLARGADIIVATPGRLMDHMEQKRVDLSNVEMLVLDEADRMLDMGFIDDVQYIAKLTPSQRQTLLFSATLDNKLMNAVKHMLKNPVRIDLSHEKIASPQIKEEMYKVNNLHHKTRLLKHFLSDENIYKAIIFSATKSHADKLAMDLRDDGFNAAALHGDLRQNVRSRTLQQLRTGKIQYLVATDVAARGIDISDITHVFNYDLPRFCEDYVHRIGRTGRAGKTGTAISFVASSDMHHLKSIERYTGQHVKLQHHDVKEVRKFESSERPAFDDEAFEDESPQRRFRSEHRERGFRRDENERSERRFSRRDDERPFRSDKRSGSRKKFGDDNDERPERKFKSERYEKPFRKEKSDRFERNSHDDRSERPERKFKSDRYERSERPFRKEKSERFEKKFADDRSERPERKFKSDRYERSEKPFRKEKSERFERKFHDDRRERPERKFKSDRPFKTEKSERFERKSQDTKPDDNFTLDRSGNVKIRYRERDESKEGRESGYRTKSKMSSGKKPRWSFNDKKHRNDTGFKRKKRKDD